MATTFPAGSTIYAVDQQGATFATATPQEQARVAAEEAADGASELRTFTCVAPTAMTGDEAADYACEHGPDTERTPCDDDSREAAALIPGDVVLGPDGWVIVEHVGTVSVLGMVRIFPQSKSARVFDRKYEDRVAVQVDADTASSASCQHFIETGRYLRRA